MSFAAGFRANNHPQQIAKRGALDDVDDRRTDPEFWARLNDRFGGFTLDAAANDENALAPSYYTLQDDGLERSWASHRVWCNPPFSGLDRWVSKAWSSFLGEPYDDDGRLRYRTEQRAELIVMLLPANRTEQGWWQTLVEPRRDKPGSPLTVEFLPGRMRFGRPNATIGPKGDRPPFGCCLAIWQDNRTVMPT